MNVYNECMYVKFAINVLSLDSVMHGRVCTRNLCTTFPYKGLQTDLPLLLCA